jgi:outer membrane immunogenic protein
MSGQAEYLLILDCGLPATSRGKAIEKAFLPWWAAANAGKLHLEIGTRSSRGTIMKRNIVGGLAVSALLISAPLTVASAADMPLKAPPPPPAPVYSWTGCYLGGNVGGIWERDTTSVVVTQDNAGQEAAAIAGGAIPVHFSYNRSSWIGGGQIGCNYQVTNWVLGIETDLDGTHLNGGRTINTNAPPFFANTSSVSQNMDWIGTTRGRLGIVTANNVLFYGTAGAAYGKVDYAYSRNNVVGGGAISYAVTDSSTQVGWTAGGGIEIAFGQWSVKGEYLYYNLGNHTVSNACTLASGAPCFVAPNATYATTFQDKGSIARIGLNYHFSGPVVH